MCKALLGRDREIKSISLILMAWLRKNILLRMTDIKRRNYDLYLLYAKTKHKCVVMFIGFSFQVYSFNGEQSAATRTSYEALALGYVSAAFDFIHSGDISKNIKHNWFWKGFCVCVFRNQPNSSLPPYISNSFCLLNVGWGPSKGIRLRHFMSSFVFIHVPFKSLFPASVRCDVLGIMAWKCA